MSALANVHLICGKICAGKSVYAKKLAHEERAVILSADEITTLFAEDLGPQHDEISRRVRAYLCRKATQIASCGVSVILDWGFWSKEMRRDAARFFQDEGIPCVWHYLDISDEKWEERIKARNASPGPADYPVDEGLKEKCLRLFQPPLPEEIDRWVRVK